MKTYYYLLFLCAGILFQSSVTGQNPTSHATFHCISLYWKPAGAAADNPCSVKYREEGSSIWKTGNPLWFDPNSHEGLAGHSHEYRGSLINMKPGTNYEIELKLDKTGTTTSLFQRTLSEDFKILKTIKLDSGKFNQPLVITEAGNEQDGYVLYDGDGQNFEIDVQKQHDFCISVNVNYVIIRGVKLKGGKVCGILLGNVHHVVIEESDISEYGTPNTSGNLAGFGINYHSAVYAASETLASHIIIQRNKLHHPSTDANCWREPVSGTHPEGPWGIKFNTNGFNIIRYNEIYSDMDHMFNDAMGAPGNFSFEGWPNRDSDVYGNRVSHVWDDGIQAEGSGMNVRIWSNYIDTVNTFIALAGASLGPIYVFRNLTHYSQSSQYPLEKHDQGGLMFKLGGNTGNYKYAKGRIMIFHNTSLQPPTPWTTGTPTAGAQAGVSHTASGKVQDHVYSRNNILHVRQGKGSVLDYSQSPTNSYDYDLYSGNVYAVNSPEKHGIKGTPQYDLNNAPGEYYLGAGKPGHDKGQVLAGLNSIYEGKAPDIGAFEREFPPLQFGIDADWNTWIEAITLRDTLNTKVTENQYLDAVKIFSLMPHPASDHVYLSFHIPEYDVIRLKIYDCMGRHVFSNNYPTPSAREVTIQTSSWKPGIYSVIAQTSKGLVQNQKLLNY